MTCTLSEEHLFCLEGCRSYKQYYKMRKGFEEDHCAFCNLDRTFNKVIFETEHVMVWKVPEEYLRDTLKLHALIVPVRHVRFEADLSEAEALDIHHAKQFVRNELGYTGGLSHVREGPMNKNAGTVDHLHINVFEVNETGEVRIPVFKDPSGRSDNKIRATRFSERYETGEIPT